jgi:hypothetical protein
MSQPPTKNPETTKVSRARIIGNLYPATKKGYLEFLLDANRLEAEGYMLIGPPTRLDSMIAATFRLIAKEKKEYQSFSPDEEEPEDDWVTL